MKTITVIIPIFNSEQYLETLFEALQKNQFFIGDEILLVDNGSIDGSVQCCEKIVNKYPDLYRLLCYTEKAGSYAARNYGVSFANGDILVFTDSDTRPDENWLTTIRDNINKGIIIAGKIKLDIVNNGLWECFDSFTHLNSEKNVKFSCIATANMAVSKVDFLGVGMFEERFSGGDYEWSMRAAKSGLKILFLENAIVHHPTRKTFEQILKKEQRIAYGTGNHYKNINKAEWKLILKYFLKIFKIDTNLRYSKKLYIAGFNIKAILDFNRKFLMIRCEQLKFAVKGYQRENARQIGIK